MIKKTEENAQKVKLALATINNLKKSNNIAKLKLKEKEIVVILWVKYGVSLSESANSEPKLVGMLKSKMGQLLETATSCDATDTINEDGIKGSIQRRI